MVAALLIGRKGSRRLPGKNTTMVLGRPLMVYPLLAARHSGVVDALFVNSDDERVIKIASEHGAVALERVPDLATDTASVGPVLADSVAQIGLLGHPVDIVVLLFCNAATVSTSLIRCGVEALQRDSTLDSAVSVGPVYRYAPSRAKRLSPEGLLVPYLDVPEDAERPDGGLQECFFCDSSLWVVRTASLATQRGQQPFPWMGQRSLPLVQSGGMDVNVAEELVFTELWLRDHGFTEQSMPYKETTKKSGAG